MFNLIVQSQPWEQGRSTIGTDRAFEYTADDLTALLKPNGVLNLPKLQSYPCLIMIEGTGDQIARVGTITELNVVGREVVFEFAIDPQIPPIPNRVIYDHRLSFNIANEFEFSRNHWAVKNINLYKAILRVARPRRQLPTVFNIEEHERTENQLVSAMMPFDAAFSEVYQAIQQAAEDSRLRCRRADDIWEAPAIIQDIVNLIDRSRVVVCDCTGRNPNVFYEIGIAHTLGREVVLITQNEADIPFDLRHLRYIPYLNNGEGRQSLRATLARRLQAIIDA